MVEDKWQSMDFAPKDGSKILAFPYLVVWWVNDCHGGFWFAGMVSEMDGDRIEEYPERWQHLPPPPITQES